MKVLIIGANGQIGTRLSKQLKDSKHEPVAMVRKKEQIEKFEDIDIETVLADLESDVSHAFKGVDAVVFTAGSGADTPKSKTKDIDRDGAIRAIDKAKNNEVDRFIMVSALKADREPETWPESMQHYYEAKAAADEHLRKSGLDYTILMPGMLTNEKGKGKVELSQRIEDTQGRSISRDDVAAVIVEAVDAPKTFGKSLDLLEGERSIAEAVNDVEIN